MSHRIYLYNFNDPKRIELTKKRPLIVCVY